MNQPAPIIFHLPVQGRGLPVAELPSVGGTIFNVMSAGVSGMGLKNQCRGWATARASLASYQAAGGLRYT